MGKTKWDLSAVPDDLSGRIVVITGTSSGLGLMTSFHLAKRGATVIGLNRNLDKAKENMDKLNTENAPLPNYHTREMDLSSFESIKAGVEKLLTETELIPRIDVLLLNAAQVNLPNREETKDGLEMQMGVNVHGHHLLASLLMPKLLQHPNRSRVVVLGSAAVGFTKKPLWDDLDFKKSYDGWMSYSLSKACNMHFREVLRGKLAAAGKSDKVHVIATHPGFTGQELPGEPYRYAANRFAMKLTKGFLSNLRSVVDDDLPDGCLLGPSGWTGYWGYPVVSEEFKPAIVFDKELAEKSWSFSVEVTGADWSFLEPAKEG